MRIISRPEIQSVCRNADVIDAVRDAFIAHSRGEMFMPSPVQMMFRSDDHTIKGDCHVKSAYAHTHPYFCIKIATGFYDNPNIGLDVNNGLVLLLSSETGEPLALFQDGGFMTSARTAAAGALAAGLAFNKGAKRLGVIGTGHQAEMQSRWIGAHCDVKNVTLFGRSIAKAQALKDKLHDLEIDIHVASSVSECARQSDVIVTTTPSVSPLLFLDDLKPGHHIVALGSDSPGKTEIESKILGHADVVITDDHRQCLEHGEFGAAVRAGYLSNTDDLNFGAVLNDPSLANIGESTVSIVDLTGLGVQDLAIVSLIYSRLH